jgi:hypothetical protein
MGVEGGLSLLLSLLLDVNMLINQVNVSPLLWFSYSSWQWGAGVCVCGGEGGLGTFTCSLILSP